MRKCAECGKTPKLWKDEKGKVRLGCRECGRHILFPPKERKLDKAIVRWNLAQLFEKLLK